MNNYNEDAYEQQCISWFKNIGWSWAHGPEIAHDGTNPERTSHKDVLLVERLEEAVSRINPGTPEDAVRKVRQMLQSPGETDVLKANQRIQSWMTEGMPVKVREDSGEEITKLLWLIDFENIENNNWLVVNQYSVQVDAEAGARRPDIVLFLNGIPIAVIELKNPSNLETDIWEAYEQLQTYKAQISRLFYYNSVLVIADGVDARMGSLTADRERFLKWRSIDGETRDPNGEFGQTETLIKGLFNKRHVLDMIQSFTVFVDGTKPFKMLPAYHQFFAVKKAYKRALEASSENGDGRGGLMCGKKL
jgi:type I restriction enzyme R subunit